MTLVTLEIARHSGQTQNWTSSARIARKTIRSLKDKPRPDPGLRAVSCRWTKGARMKLAPHEKSQLRFSHPRPSPTIPRWNDLTAHGKMRRGKDFAWGHGLAHWLMTMLSMYSVRRSERSIALLPATVRNGRYHHQVRKILYRDTIVSYWDTYEDTFTDTRWLLKIGCKYIY